MFVWMICGLINLFNFLAGVQQQDQQQQSSWQQHQQDNQQVTMAVSTSLLSGFRTLDQSFKGFSLQNRVHGKIQFVKLSKVQKFEKGEERASSHHTWFPLGLEKRESISHLGKSKILDESGNFDTGKLEKILERSRIFSARKSKRRRNVLPQKYVG